MELAKRDPDGLERLRIQQINQLIESAPEHLKARLKGLQFQIDCKRRLHNKSPLGSCIEISRMMMDSLLSLNETLQSLYIDEGHTKPPHNNAMVLTFPKSNIASNAQ
jgi:Protein of unknown function (DUF3135).